MTSKTEAAIVAFVDALTAKSALDDTVIPEPLRNEALPSRLTETGGGLMMHLNVWDGNTTIDQEMLGADVITDGYELSHELTVEYVVARGSAAEREAAFDLGVKAILGVVSADRTIDGTVSTTHVTEIISKQRELVTQGLPNCKGADITVRLEFVDSDIR